MRRFPQKKVKTFTFDHKSEFSAINQNEPFSAVVLPSYLPNMNTYVRNFDLNNDDEDDGVDIFEGVLKTHAYLYHKPLNT